MKVGGKSLLWFENVRMNLYFKEARIVMVLGFFSKGSVVVELETYHGGK